MGSEMDHYALLGVGRDASDEEIRRAYRELMRLWHPDRRGSAGEGMTARLNVAYETLNDASSRRAYDGSLAGPVPAAPERATGEERPQPTVDPEPPAAPSPPVDLAAVSLPPVWQLVRPGWGRVGALGAPGVVLLGAAALIVGLMPDTSRADVIMPLWVISAAGLFHTLIGADRDFRAALALIYVAAPVLPVVGLFNDLPDQFDRAMPAAAVASAGWATVGHATSPVRAAGRRRSAAKRALRLLDLESRGATIWWVDECTVYAQPSRTVVALSSMDGRERIQTTLAGQYWAGTWVCIKRGRVVAGAPGDAFDQLRDLTDAVRP